MVYRPKQCVLLALLIGLVVFKSFNSLVIKLRKVSILLHLQNSIRQHEGLHHLHGFSDHISDIDRSLNTVIDKDSNNHIDLDLETKKNFIGNTDKEFNVSASIVFTLLAALAIAISYADRSNLSTAIIPMADQFHWDGFFSGLVLSSFWLGYASTQILGGKLADMIGGELLIIIALLLWSLCTALTPVTANHGSLSIIVDRVLLGAGEGLGR